MKKRFYPKKIKINNTWYALSFAKHVSKDHSDRGICDLYDKQVLIKDNLNEKLTFETFIHECMHAIEREYNLEVSHSLITNLEEPLADFIRNNFHIIPKH